MKLIIPLEFRIQQKGEQYGDDDLLECSLEVYTLKMDLQEEKARTKKLSTWLTVLTVILMGASFLHGLGKL